SRKSDSDSVKTTIDQEGTGKLTINSLPDSGVVTLLAAVKEVELRPKRSGGVYLHLLLGDRTAEVEARVWDGAEEIAKLFAPDGVVKFRGASAVAACYAVSVIFLCKIDLPASCRY